MEFRYFSQEAFSVVLPTIFSRVNPRINMILNLQTKIYPNEFRVEASLPSASHTRRETPAPVYFCKHPASLYNLISFKENITKLIYIWDLQCLRQHTPFKEYDYETIYSLKDYDCSKKMKKKTDDKEENNKIHVFLSHFLSKFLFLYKFRLKI